MFPQRLRRNQIILAVLLILSVVILTLHWRVGSESFFSRTQRVVTGLIAPLQAVVSKTVAPFRHGWQYFVEIGGLRKENTKLKKEAAKLREEVISLKEARRENRRLRRMVGFKGETAYMTLPSRIIGKSPNNWQATVIVNRGFSEGVALRMPVVSGEGLVGQVSKVSSHAAEVQLILDQKSGVGAQLQEGGERGVLQGELGRELRLEFISKNARVKPGEAVITSGLGGVFPKGLLIGFTSEVKVRPYSMYKEIEVVPAVKFSQLEEVLIIANPEPKVPWEKE